MNERIQRWWKAQSLSDRMVWLMVLAGFYAKYILDVGTTEATGLVFGAGLLYLASHLEKKDQ